MTEYLFTLDDGVQRFDVHRCLVCGELLDLLDRVLHKTAHEEAAK